MSEALEPSLLVSMPQMQDPNFARAVVLLCNFTPEGAFGLILNRPTDMAASTMVKLEPAVAAANAIALSIGGPVEPERGWILLADRPAEAEYQTICEGVYLSTSPTLLRSVLSQDPAPRALVLAGYAGWGPGQLDEELAQSAWLIGSVDSEIVFGVAATAMWETAIRRLGADPSTLQTSRGVH
ncbi:MAG TPA: YqgE/AlgH family protein [Vicinamibacterales bacterium]|jgi:putative transcriptional regulator